MDVRSALPPSQAINSGWMWRVSSFTGAYPARPALLCHSVLSGSSGSSGRQARRPGEAEGEEDWPVSGKGGDLESSSVGPDGIGQWSPPPKRRSLMRFLMRHPFQDVTTVRLINKTITPNHIGRF
ncbi:hypothetical protein AAFF_G00180700 [Aldrovandia affinis]|uniref:Uncharacterized protein n=1 Tax=Aldrovandia affinis TaxID=143900 RepID=A0AAD7SYE0_9TELE|nr:hypothetical protein AAFF_G00180700 [Aldrovandia affinis]